MDSLSVGFCRIDVTPDEPTPLAGYGNTAKRISENILDPICSTCIAISDSKGKTVLLYTHDIINNHPDYCKKLRETLSKETGVFADDIFICSTHTHSAPDIHSPLDSVKNFFNKLISKEVEAAKIAIKNREKSSLYYACGFSSPLNFIRHYTAEDGGVLTDNHDTRSSMSVPLTGHCSEIDRTLQVLKFKRETQKDIYFVSWRAHGTKTGGLKKKDMSADYPYSLRYYLEKDLDCHCAYFQGCAGNVNPKSRIEEEDPTQDYMEYGRLLANDVLNILENIKPIESGDIKTLSKTVDFDVNHAFEDQMDDVLKVSRFFEETNDQRETMKYAQQFGLFSAYHANAIKSRAKLPKVSQAELKVLSLGSEIGFCFMPGEPFDETGKYIRDISPFKNTVVMGYTGPLIGYVPTHRAFKYGCYETDCTKVGEGTAERFADTLIDMLKDIK